MTDRFLVPRLGLLVARQRMGAWVLVLAIVASALLLGSLLSWALCTITFLLAIAVFLLWFDAERTRARPVASVVLCVGLGLLAFTSLQCIPMPASLLATIAPGNADVWARALTPLREAGPRYATISLDPSSTHVQVLRGIAYVLTFLAALRVAQRREGSEFLQNALVACGVILAVAALIHPAFGAEKVFWIYKPSGAVNGASRHLAPLLNANHLAGYVNVAICVALGAAVTPRSMVSRIVLFATFLMLIGVEIWIASRGGIVGLVLGIAVVLVMSLAARRGRHAGAIQALVVGGVLATSVVMIVLAASDDVWNELASADVSKLELARDALRLVHTSPWLGVGRGAFESTFPAVRTLPGYIGFTHPENLVIQWASEWGIPVTLVAMGALAFALRPSSVMARSQPPIGAWAAIAALTVHNLVDFSMEVPGVMMPLAVCAAIITGGSAGDSRRSGINMWATRTRVVAFSALAIAVAGILLVVPGMGHELIEDQFAMKDRAIDPATTPAEFRARMRDALLRHPGEPYFPFLGALRAANARDESVIPWVERTLERAPVYGLAHLILAHEIYARSPSQARLEYRLALEQDTSLTPRFEAEAPPLVRSFDDAMELLPETLPTRSVALYALITRLHERLPATSKRLDDELARVEPTDPLPLRRAAIDALADLRGLEAAPWCAADRKACVSGALAAADRLRAREPDQCEGYLFHAQVLIAEGDTKRGLDELGDAANHVSEWNACTRALIDAARDAKDDARVTAGLARLTRAGCGTDDECLQTMQYVVGVELARGNARRALAVYKQAYERVPSDDLLLASGQLAARIGLHAEALEDFEKLAQKNPSDARFPPLIGAERQAISQTVSAPSRSPGQPGNGQP